MADFQRVDVRGWEYDLHSVYSAYLGHFQLHGIPWYDRSWGHLFESFAEFLTFSWPVVVVTDAHTGKAHIVTRLGSVGAFVKMVKTRFGETLPNVDNMYIVEAFESTPRRLHTITDWATYKKLHATLPAAAFSAYKAHVRGGDPKAIRDLWAQKDKTFLAVDFEWSERNPNTALEWGYAAVRCWHLDAVGSWPPDPETNYRKGHYIVSEYVDKDHNRHTPNYPWQYAFGESQIVGKAKLPTVVQAIISSMATPDSETTANTVVLVGHGIHSEMSRIEALKIKLPHNMLIVDTALFERELFSSGQRGPMTDAKTGNPRSQGTTLSLGNCLRSMGVDVQTTLHNSGNDAFLTLLALQLLLDPQHTKIPAIVVNRQGVRRPSPLPMLNMPMMVPVPPHARVPGPTSSTPQLRHSGIFANSPNPNSPSAQFAGSMRYSGYLSASPGTSPSFGQGDGYFGRQSPVSGATVTNRNSRRMSSLLPDEMGGLKEMKENGSTERLSQSMRDLKVGQ